MEVEIEPKIHPKTQARNDVTIMAKWSPTWRSKLQLLVPNNIKKTTAILEVKQVPFWLELRCLKT